MRQSVISMGMERKGWKIPVQETISKDEVKADGIKAEMLKKGDHIAAECMYKINTFVEKREDAGRLDRSSDSVFVQRKE